MPTCPTMDTPRIPGICAICIVRPDLAQFTVLGKELEGKILA